jgi:hypothetical protein
MNRILFATLFAILQVAPVFAQNQMQGTTLKLGSPTTANKDIIFDISNGAANPRIRANGTTDRLEFTNDGSLFKILGSGSGGGSSGINLLANPGFEDGATSSWTNSGGTYAEVTSGSNLLFGEKSATFQAANSGEYFQSELVTIPEILKGKPCAVYIHSKGGDGNLKIQVVDGAGALIQTGSEQVIFPNPVSQRTGVGFGCPTSGQMRLKVISTAASALHAFDNAHLGSGEEVEFSQARVIGKISWVKTANCSFPKSSSPTTLGAFAVDADCPVPTVEGEIQAVGTKIPAFTIPKGDKGTYLFRTTLSPTPDTAGAVAYYAFSDGTNTSELSRFQQNGGSVILSWPGLSGSITYSQPFTNKQIDIYGSATTGTAFLNCNSDGPAGTCAIEVLFLPSSSSKGIINNLDTDFGWTEGGTLTFGALTTPPTKGTVAKDRILYKRHGDTGKFRYEYRQTTSGTNGNGDYLLSLPNGLRFDSSKVAFYTGTLAAGGANEEGAAAGRGLGQVRENGNGDGDGWIVPYDATRFRVFWFDKYASSDVWDHDYYDLAISTIGLQIEFEVPIEGWNTRPGTYAVNGFVSSKSSSVKVAESARIAQAARSTKCTSSPCTTYGDYSSWISSAVRNGTGDYTLNLAAGAFGTIPQCSVTPLVVDGDRTHTYFPSDASTSAVNVRFHNTADVAVDTAFDIICLGSK